MSTMERRLRKQVCELEKELAEVKADREIFRDHFSRRFRWWVELMGKGEKPNLAWLVENDARTLNRVAWWSW